MDSTLFDSQLKQLAALLNRSEFEFASSAPVLGAVFQRLRQRWNNISTRWYVNHAVAQQVAFDTQLVQMLTALTDYTRQLETQNAKLKRRLDDMERLHELDVRMLSMPGHR